MQYFIKTFNFPYTVKDGSLLYNNNSSCTVIIHQRKNNASFQNEIIWNILDAHDHLFDSIHHFAWPNDNKYDLNHLNLKIRGNEQSKIAFCTVYLKTENRENNEIP